MSDIDMNYVRTWKEILFWIWAEFRDSPGWEQASAPFEKDDWEYIRMLDAMAGIK